MGTNPQQHIPKTGEHMTVESYLQWDALAERKYEFEHGVVRLMSGVSVAHSTIAFNVRRAIKERIQGKLCSVSGPSLRARIADDVFYYPNVLVSYATADRRLTTTTICSPRLVVEVLSPSTEALDRGRKLANYKACPTIQEIIFVSQFSQHVEIYRRTDNGIWPRQPVIYEPGDDVPLESIDVIIPISEFYDSLDFDETVEE